MKVSFTSSTEKGRNGKRRKRSGGLGSHSIVGKTVAMGYPVRNGRVEPDKARSSCKQYFSPTIQKVIFECIASSPPSQAWSRVYK